MLKVSGRAKCPNYNWNKKYCECCGSCSPCDTDGYSSFEVDLGSHDELLDMLYGHYGVCNCGRDWVIDPESVQVTDV